ncbi:aldo/keto reductase [Candidatus Dojkabacteria bacterium]|nr:aldo/keto reductase [Candidatus Dojkabacteria bacterium]
MNYRKLGKTDLIISEIAFGAWAIGGSWGNVDDSVSLKALNKAIDMGVNFIDTADVYGDGRSEKLVSKLSKSRKENIYIATKFGRRSDPHISENYNEKKLRKYLERSLKNLNVEAIDLIQLHCPPTEVYYRPEIFSFLEDLNKEGLVKNYGVSVEKVEEGLKAIEYPGVSTVQIIYNMFRQRPAGQFFKQAQNKNIGIICRVPLASGLLTGKFDKKSNFEKGDHRNFNREGQAFDKGETFGGVPFEIGVETAKELEKNKPKSITMSQFALKWILEQSAVSCAIVGCKTPKQAEENFEASDGLPLTNKSLGMVKKLYQKNIKAHVHDLW